MGGVRTRHAGIAGLARLCSALCGTHEGERLGPHQGFHGSCLCLGLHIGRTPLCLRPAALRQTCSCSSGGFRRLPRHRRPLLRVLRPPLPLRPLKFCRLELPIHLRQAAGVLLALLPRRAQLALPLLEAVGSCLCLCFSSRLRCLLLRHMPLQLCHPPLGSPHRLLQPPMEALSLAP